MTNDANRPADPPVERPDLETWLRLSVAPVVDACRGDPNPAHPLDEVMERLRKRSGS